MAGTMTYHEHSLPKLVSIAELERAEIGIANLLRVLGQDPDREGLASTPQRVVRAMQQMTAGYHQNPQEILSRQFAGDSYDDLVVVRGIRFSSLCEHHLLPFVGTCAVAYLPHDKVVGLSKLPRLVECYAMRLQLQERMTRQIAEAVMTHLEPRGVGVCVQATHQCMACRGVRQPDADMLTTTVLGEMRDNPSLKSEFTEAVGMRHGK